MSHTKMMTPTDETTSGKKGVETEEMSAFGAETTEPPSEQGVALDEMSREQLLEKVQELQTLSDKNYSLYVRSEADIDNVKKRFAREKTDLIKYAAESLIKQILPVMDNLEKAIGHGRNDGGTSAALLEGVELTLKGLKDALAKAGLEEIDAVGKPFDPNFHEATLQRQDATVEPGIVIEEYQKGYLLNDRLIRPSMVAVSAGVE